MFYKRGVKKKFFHTPFSASNIHERISSFENNCFRSAQIFIKTLFSKTKISREQAMTALKIPETDHPKYMAML